MKSNVVKFNSSEKADFYRTLTQRVNQYFKDNNKSKYANGTMKFKTAFMLSLYFIPFAILLFAGIQSYWILTGLWALMGIGMAGIGLSIMHDANHGAYSQKKWVNRVLGFTSNFCGVSDFNWRIQHNILHHTYTNIHGLDDDIDAGAVLRFSPTQKHRKFHNFQIYYAWFLYGLMTINWLITKDFNSIKVYKERDLLKKENRTPFTAWFELSLLKLGYVGLTLVLPIFILATPWWGTVLSFLMMHFICGLSLSLIFQPAHVLTETDFYELEEDGCMKNNWAVHQLKTTADFAHKSKFFSWFIGGLNYQIEHHLFQNICHVHYKDLSKIVRQTAEEYGLPYHNHRTFVNALRSHFKLINQLGKGEI